MGLLIEILIFVGFIGSVIWAGVKNTASTVSAGVKDKMDEWNERNKNLPKQPFSNKNQIAVTRILRDGYYIYRVDNSSPSCYDVFIFGAGYACNFRYYLPMDDEVSLLIYTIQNYLQDEEAINETKYFIETMPYGFNRYIVIGNKTELCLTMGREAYYTEYGHSIALPPYIDEVRVKHICTIQERHILTDVFVENMRGTYLFTLYTQRRYRFTQMLVGQ